jgi:hypothetical protein
MSAWFINFILCAGRKGQWFTVDKGSNFSTSTAKPETDLTVEMLTSWVQIIPETYVHFILVQWRMENFYLQKIQLRSGGYTH